MTNKIIAPLALSLTFTCALAGAAAHTSVDAKWTADREAIWDTRAKRWVTLEDVAQHSERGDHWVLGEVHATASDWQEPETIVHHDNQLRLLQALQKNLAASMTRVSLGMEFFNYPKQSVVDAYITGQLTEAEFLQNVDWGSNPFGSYREQVLFPAKNGGRTYALNMPRAVTSQVAKGGPASLPPELRQLLPPLWDLGNDLYFVRFREAMGSHVPEEKLLNYFWAHSLWDDTMAWRATQALLESPDQVLLTIAGAFHVQFGGGLPDSLKKYGAKRIQTVLQYQTPDWTSGTLDLFVAPHPRYGARADFIWLHSGNFTCEGRDCPR